MASRVILCWAAILDRAASLTGQTYKRGEYDRAIADLTTFLKSFDMGS